MNAELLKAPVRLINRHGVMIQYKSVTQGVYDVETGSVSNTEVTYSLKAYQYQGMSLQKDFPDLVEKEVSVFLVAGLSCSFTPKVGDKIESGSDLYSVSKIIKHQANSTVALWRFVCVKG